MLPYLTARIAPFKLRIGRIAGQYAKPRSSSFEKIGDREVLSFRLVISRSPPESVIKLILFRAFRKKNRGDNVNGYVSLLSVALSAKL